MGNFYVVRFGYEVCEVILMSVSDTLVCEIVKMFLFELSYGKFLRCFYRKCRYVTFDKYSYGYVGMPYILICHCIGVRYVEFCNTLLYG
jgi:hypothetical protein